MPEPKLDIWSSMAEPKLEDTLVGYESREPISGEGCNIYVHYSGPTDQMATLCTGMVTLAPGASPHPPHKHPEEETIIIAEGSGEMSIEGKVTPTKRGDILYVNGNTEHGVTNTGATPMTFYFTKWIAKGFEPAR